MRIMIRNDIQTRVRKVIEVYSDKAGFVRSVKVKARGSEKVRPITKLCLLEASDGDATCEESIENKGTSDSQGNDNLAIPDQPRERPKRIVKPPTWHQEFVS